MRFFNTFLRTAVGLWLAAGNAPCGAVRPAVSRGLPAWRAVLVALVAGAATVAAAAPTVTDVAPRTLTPGTSTVVTVTGTELAGLRAAVSQGSVAVDASTAGQAVLTVSLPADAAGGLGLWLFPAAGTVETFPLLVDPLPTVVDAATNQSASTAQPLTLPCAVDGIAGGPAADWFVFSVAAGERLAIEVLTQSLHSAMDPVLVLYDSEGRHVATADDDAVGPECRFETTFVDAGEYRLELRESRHVAGGRYHLRIGDFPIDVACHPLAIQRGQPSTLQLSAASTDAGSLVAVERTIAPDDRRDSIWISSPAEHPAWARVRVTDVPEWREEDATAPLTPPLGLSGRLTEAGEIDTYRLTAAAGDTLRVRSQTRSLGCPTLARMRVVAADGSTLAETTPGESDEWTLTATLPTDGDVQLEVTDLLGRGGHSFGYHLDITAAADFAVALAGDAKTRQAFTLQPGDGGVAIPLSITRQGFSGPIELSLAPSSAGLELVASTVPADATEHRVFLRATAAWEAADMAVVRLTARATETEDEPRTVGSLAVDRAREPRVPFPEDWLSGTVALAGAEAAAPLFAFELAEPLTCARPVTTHAATMPLTRLTEGFADAVTLIGTPLPEGWSLATNADKDTYTATLTRTDPASEPDEVMLLAYGEHAGRGRLIEVPVPLRWIDPLLISAEPTSPLVAGRVAMVPITVSRRGDTQPVVVTITAAPEGWPLPDPITLAPDASVFTLPVSVPAAASGQSHQLTYTAASSYAGQDYTITGTLPLPEVIPTPTRLEVFPQQLELADGADARQLVVTGFDADGGLRDWTHDVLLRPASPGIIEVHGSRVVPVGDGETELVVSIGDLQHTIPVRVTGSSNTRPIAFESEVIVALSKQGCSSGACHGSPSGKGLFRLSLRGFDAVLDELTLIREDFGRRVNTFEPEASLLLAKPLMQVSHGGGKQLRETDAAYAVLRQWIAEGARPDAADTPRCVGIEITPGRKRVLALAGGSQQVAVLARFADGSVRDVTHLAAYESSNTSVASVDAQGRVVPAARGETVVLARFLEHIESLPLTFLDPDPTFAWQAPPAQNILDERVDEKLRLLQHTPSPVCSDDEFLRRVTLDVIGLLPTLAETRAFLEDTSPHKREAVIDQLLNREEYASYQALKWGDILRMTAKAVGNDGVYKYHRWVEDAFRSNMPYDQFARELLAAEGSTLSNPPANFYRSAATATDCVETVSQVFLGARLQCAKCHNHPFEKWTQDNYYGLAAFFEPVKRRTTQRPGEMFVYTAAGDGVTQPRTGERMKPWLPGEGSLDLAEAEDGRERLVDWLVRPDNPFFAKIEANRIWSSCFSRGIVDPVDDFRDSNPPSNGPLLETLTQAFIDSGYDRKALLRLILTSRTYQASVRTTDSNATDTTFFSHQMPRLLSAEQLLDAIGQVTDVPDAFSGLPANTKATQLPAPDLADVEFLEIFGQPQRSTVCACERSRNSNLGMAIAMFNGDMIHTKLGHETNRFRRGLAEGRTVEALIDELYVAALCRHPDQVELQAALAHVGTRETPAEGLEDVCWALLNTDEFLFQH